MESVAEISSFYNNKRVFITGHTGFKGTWLTRILMMFGADVVGYSLEPPTNPSLFNQTRTGNQIHSVIGDVRDRAKLTTVMQEARPDIVLHLAAQPIVRTSYKEPVLTYETNVMGTVNVLEAVREVKSIRSVVNVTTDKVYLNREREAGYREDEELCGYDPYSNSKSCSELVTYSYRNSFFADKSAPAISTARSGNVIGGGDYAADRIIPDCIRAVEQGQPIMLRNPNSTRPYQHVLECLRGYLILAQKQYLDKTITGAYNFGPDDESCVTTGELATLFCDKWGDGVYWESKKELFPPPYEATFLKLDNTKAKKILNWFPKWDIKIAVEKTIEWEKAVKKGISAAEITDNQIKEYLIYLYE
ncbi:MAG: CDP-glucose 4,6-dehydratase [Spirochaetia bacterium]|nr:CDP-glucose 4,6-dehydratase [Spirochaetia bacterium]